MSLQDTFKAVKEASKTLVLLSDDQRNEILNAVADAIDQHQGEILKANADDLEKAGKDYAFYDRLLLTPQRLKILPTTCGMWRPFLLRSGVC